MTAIKKLTNLPAPAKMNLFLHVVGRRPDGMHLLESLFILIDLADTLDIEVIESGEIVRTGDVVGDPEKDLCVRAARSLRAASGCRLGARIHVVKRIPSGAGLGGGSSDCATTLLALNRLWGLGWGRQELMDIGQSLGADVPFFIFGQNAFAAGTGNELTAFDAPPGHWAVAMPEKPTSTALIFSDKGLTRDTKSLTMSHLSDRMRTQWPFFGHNDLQPVAARINPQIQTALDFFGPEARMTGSGSAVFVPAASPEDARSKLIGLPTGMHGYATATLREHPLRGFLSDGPIG